MPSPYEPQGEVFPPAQHGAGHRPMPDYEKEASRPNSRTSGWNVLAAPGTYLLVGINCAVYLWMVLNGVSPSDPTPMQLIHYGANVPLLVLHGQWYRLLTATFVHVGIIHIATNMWCLWNLGLLGEPLLGPMGLIAVYMLTGIAGNLLSTSVNVIDALLRHGPLEFFVGAGASGAVFGIAGILIVLLSNRKLPIPWYELKRLRRSVIWFAVVNLMLGVGANFTSIVRVDNFAHLGGFLSGLAIGVPLLPRMTSGRTRYLQRQKVTFAAAAFGLALFGYWIANLR
ncbi:rhomboid family intramembrane serine protease [Edaphobacter sp.]|uniref:rhomboid family intramembrane serine protease n=1 Tax=Edaphobacter sp. TaxID=1934404 RepID=UPI002DBD8909|nr:rhomboid family intramembrane serine protease [Edaphobacter sp.]HEU5341557.1 rhomboid family intramembrane serine protease [Edaphobacter sp.]